MDRLAKKCIIASGIVHGTLVLLLIVGPAFIPANSKPDSLPPMTYIPLVASESGEIIPPKGRPDTGRQNPQPEVRRTDPPLSPPPVRPVPVKETRAEPAPKPEAPKPGKTTKLDPDALEPSPTKRTGPVVDLRNVVTRKDLKDSSQKNSTAADDAKARDDARKRAQAFANALKQISSGVSGSVVVDDKIGDPNGQGEGSAPFMEILKSIYFNNWHEPSDATIEDAVVKVTVTVARDGSVMNARITKSSGDPAVDRSVQRTLDNVKTIAPFPPSWTERERQFPINFSLKAKRAAA